MSELSYELCSLFMNKLECPCSFSLLQWHTCLTSGGFFELLSLVSLLPWSITNYLKNCAGGNADYAMDLHQKEQFHDNAVSMMQSQHFSVSPKFLAFEKF